MASVSIWPKNFVKELRSRGIRAEHVMGIFTLDEPGAWRYRSDEDEEFDEYEVNHDWSECGGKNIGYIRRSI